VDGFPTGATPQDGEACLDFGPSDRDQRLLIGGSQSPTYSLRSPRGLAQELSTVQDSSGKPVLGIILNSHWINSGDTPRSGGVKITLYPTRGKPKRLMQPLFEVLANGFLRVPPGTTKTVTSAFPPFLQIPGGLGGGRVPDGPACIVMLTAHMHKRGKRFRPSTRRATPARVSTRSRATPRCDAHHERRRLDPAPLLLRPGEKLTYTCTHDNGVTTPVKMGCEEHFPGRRACSADNTCARAAGSRRGVPQRARPVHRRGLLPGKLGLGEALRRRRRLSDDATYTGRCVPLHLPTNLHPPRPGSTRTRRAAGKNAIAPC
jgi:hypothetical protein